jgi:hypothetical protein
MTDERYNELLRGPLYHPLPMCTFTRLSLALAHVTWEFGKTAADALENFCNSPKPEARENYGRLSPDRFNELLNGPLAGRSPMETIENFAHALKFVVDACGEPAAELLEAHCADRDAEDYEETED